MIVHHVEPELRQLRQHRALHGNGRGKHDVERRNSVGRNQQDLVSILIQIANLSSAEQLQSSQLCLDTYIRHNSPFGYD